MLLKDKVIVVYGAGGGVGGAVAKAFAREGAKLFLTGRRLGPVQEIARSIEAAGGAPEMAELDATDERGIGKHLDGVVAKAGRVDVSFNAVGVQDTKLVGVPLTELAVEHFTSPIQTYAASYFLTARLAARHMMRQKSGVIMTVSALVSRVGTRLNGGYGASQAAKEALTRDLSAELAPHGIRVVGIRPHGMTESSKMRELFELKASRLGMSWQQFEAYLAGNTHPKRVMTLAEAANMAAFLASDRASGMTGTTVNMTMGNLDD